MAQGKKSFTAYCDWIESFKELSNEDAGILIKHILEYVNDLNPVSDQPVIKYGFPQIKTTLKRDLKKWEAKRDKNRQNALIRWDKNNANASERIQTNAKHTVSVSDSVLDSNINITTNIEEVEKWILDLPNHQIWKEGVYRTHKLRSNVLSNIANEFKEHLKVYPTKHKNIEDFKKHLSSWIGLKIRNGEFKNYLKQSIGQL